MIGDKGALRAGFGRLGSSIGLAAVVLALSFAIAWPLWIFATKARSAFTLTVGAVAALVLSALAARAVYRRVRSRRSRRGNARASGSPHS